MSLKKILNPLTLAIVALVGANMAEVRAATIVQTGTAGPQDITAAPLSKVFSFNPYTGPAGTLLSVVLSVEETVGGVVTVYNFKSTPFVFTNASINGTATVSDSVGGSATVNASSTVTGGSVPSGNIVNAPPVFVGVANFVATPTTTTNSATYTGAGVIPYYGSVTPILASVVAPPAFITGTPGGTDHAYTGTTVASIRVTLTYNTSVIPEPTSSAMFGIGIALAAGLGWARKRRSMSKLAI